MSVRPESSASDTGTPVRGLADEIPEGIRFVVGELIDDREIKEAERDLLGHKQIAYQLADLSRSVEMPANVALYGPWGSGKTGIANLLKTELKDKKRAKNQRIKFARFDAFKFAEAPLRRNFISAVASELGMLQDEFHSDLYRDKTSATYDLTGKQKISLTALIFSTVLLVSAAAFLVALLVSAIQPGKFTEDLAKNVGPIVGAGFPLAALIAALAVLVNRRFAVDTKTGKPESDEEYERIFKRLVAEAHVDRLVIFVDEVDRCSSKEVVATLDAVRTFLDVPKCVFIVAADQQVLEEALSRDVKQATPADTRNPYYSAGSAYLDKVFQYQVSLPPLRYQSISGFAADIVRGRPGVWQCVDTDYLATVLVPSHVQSPRRVKHLLNAFVLAYRLAEVRRVEGRLDTNVQSRANELARLVCFRVEFPLFARDLITDHLLVDYVFTLAERTVGADDEFQRLFPYITPAMKELAQKYVAGDADVARTLLDDDDSASEQDRQQDDAVRRSHGAQLLDYLSRTQAVPTPKPDLIFMQSSGVTFGLDAALVEQIEIQARNRSITAMRQSLEPLPPEQRQAVVSLLSQEARMRGGLERDNVVRTLLTLHGQGALDLSVNADVVLQDALPAINSNPSDLLDAGTAPGAWSLAIQTDSRASLALRRTILALPLLRTRTATAAAILATRPTAAVHADRAVVVELVGHHLLGDSAGEFVAPMKDLADEEGAALLDVVAKDLGKALADLITTADKARAAAADVATPASPTPANRLRPTQPPTTPSEDEEGDQDFQDDAPILSALQDWGASADGKPRTAEALIRLLLLTEQRKCHDAVANMLPQVTPVHDPRTSDLILAAVPRLWVREWHTWLTATPSGSTTSPQLAQRLTAIVQELFREATKDGTDPALISQAAEDIYRLAAALANTDRTKIGDGVLASLSGHAADDEEAAARVARLTVAARLMDQGLLNRPAFLQREAAALADTLIGLEAEEPVSDGPLADYLKHSIAATISGWGGPEPHRDLSDDATRTLIAAIDETTGLTEPLHMALRLEARRVALRQETRVSPPPIPDVLAVLKTPEVDVPTLASAWLTVAEPTRSDLNAILRAVTPDRRSGPFLEAFGARRAQLPDSEQQHLINEWLSSPDKNVPPERVCRALGIADLNDAAAADLIVQRHQASTNNDQRERALRLWAYADITTESVRRRLFEEVLYNQFAHNAQATRVGLDALPRLAQTQPRRTKKALQDAVERAVQDDEALQRKALKTLASIGYETERSGFWGLGGRKLRKIQEDPDDVQMDLDDPQQPPAGPSGDSDDGA